MSSLFFWGGGIPFQKYETAPIVQLKKLTQSLDSLGNDISLRCGEGLHHKALNDEFLWFFYTFCWTCFCLLCWNSHLCVFKAARTDTIFQYKNMGNYCIFGFSSSFAVLQCRSSGKKLNLQTNTTDLNKSSSVWKGPESVHHPFF